MTPEGKTKAKIKKLLNSHDVYSYMPVSNGMGAPSLDYLCCVRGKFFAVEAKAWDSKKDLTDRQQLTAESIDKAGAPVFMVRDAITMGLLDSWLTSITHDLVKVIDI